MLEPIPARGKGLREVHEVRQSDIDEINESIAALNASYEFDTVADLLADTKLSYTAGPGLFVVAAGDYIRVKEGGFVYKVVDSGASEFHFENTNAVKMSYVQSGAAQLLAFGPNADGVTDDSSYFKMAESLSVSDVDLGGRSYSITSIWSDPTNGVNLTKNYRNGKIIRDGSEVLIDDNFSRSISALTTIKSARSNRRCALYMADGDNYQCWAHKLGPVWASYKITRSGAGLPFNLTETSLKLVMATKAARETGVVYTGGWATDTTTTALKSGDDSYISGRAQQSITVGDYVEVTFTGGGDLYVVFVGRTSGNYVNVLLDGAQEHLILADDGSGNSYFDSYTQNDLSYKQVVQIANGVPEATHTVRLTVSASKNAASTGNRFIFNALTWDSESVGPWDEETDAPLWASGQSVLTNQRRKYGQNYYLADADGTTGSTPPTHTSGSVSDGAVNWTYVSTSSYELVEHRLQAAGSQLEYAYQIRPAGASSFEDVGGALHGNEAQVSSQWYVSGGKITPLAEKWFLGDEIEVVESLDVTHSEIGGGATTVNKTALRRRFLSEFVEISHEHDFQTDGTFGYFYPHMWPLLHYDGPNQKFGVLKVFFPSDRVFSPSDYYGVANTFVGRTKDVVITASGEALQPDGSGGVPTTDQPKVSFTASLEVDVASVESYRSARSVLASVDMNTSGGDASAGGYSSITSKMYFERYSSGEAVSYSSGDKISCSARYRLIVHGV